MLTINEINFLGIYNIIDKYKKLSTGEVARLCGFTTVSVNNWIKTKKIKAYRTPGGQYRIIMADLVDFIRKTNIPIPKEMKDIIKKKLLIIDDEDRNIQIISKITREIREDIEISIRNDIFEGLIAIGDIKPDMLFLNYDLSGIEFGFSYKLKSNKILDKTKIFLMIAKSSLLKEKLYEYNTDEIIEKPISMNKIAELLKNTIKI